MKALKSFCLYSVTILLFSACDTKPSKETSGNQQDHTHHHAYGVTGADEVMAIHDSIMLRMGELMELSEAVKARTTQLDSLKKDGYEREITVAKDLVKELDLAGESMMTWMDQFKADTLEKLDETAAREYLSEQKKGILDVKSGMEMSILKARNFVASPNRQFP